MPRATPEQMENWKKEVVDLLRRRPEGMRAGDIAEALGGAAVGIDFRIKHLLEAMTYQGAVTFTLRNGRTRQRWYRLASELSLKAALHAWRPQIIDNDNEATEA